MIEASSHYNNEVEVGRWIVFAKPMSLEGLSDNGLLGGEWLRRGDLVRLQSEGGVSQDLVFTGGSRGNSEGGEHYLMLPDKFKQLEKSGGESSSEDLIVLPNKQGLIVGCCLQPGEVIEDYKYLGPGGIEVITRRRGT